MIVGVNHALTLNLPDELVDSLADALADRLASRLAARTNCQSDQWLDSKKAADYLGISRTAIHKLTSARQVSFSQTVPGAPCFFRRQELDAYRERSMRGGPSL